MNKHLTKILVALTVAAMTVSQPIAGHATENVSSVDVSVTRTYEFKVGDEVTSKETVASGGKLTAPEAPAAEAGKSFDGWYTENGEKFDFDASLTFTDSSTVTLTAHFSDAANKGGNAVNEDSSAVSDAADEETGEANGETDTESGETDEVGALYNRLIAAKTIDELQAMEESLSDAEEKLMESFTQEQQEALTKLAEKLGAYDTNATVSNGAAREVEAGSTITITGTSGYQNSWSSSNQNVARITGNAWGAAVTVEGISEGTATITHTYYVRKGPIYYKQQTETFEVSVRAASATVKVYVYVASEGFSDEMYELLGIDKDTLDNNGYFPAGIIELNKSWLNGKNTEHGKALIQTDDDWTTLLGALGNMDVSNMVSMQGKDYGKNNGNHVAEYIGQAEKALRETWNSGSTALFRWHYVPDGTAERESSTCEYGGCRGNATHYGFAQQAGVLYHLDLKFSTKTITFITGNNGIGSGEAKDGTKVDSRTYITGSEIQEPRNLNVPDGYKLVGYYTSPNFEEGTEWNGIGTPLKKDQTVYIKIVPQDNVTLKYVVAEGEGTVKPTDESFNPMTGSWTGSTAAAGTGYTFAGWYAEKECTNLLSENEQFKPEKPTTGWAEGGTYTYYAKFIPSDKVLTIKKTLSGNMYDASKTFTFTISSDLDMKWTTASGEQTGKTITVSLGKDQSTAEGEATVWDIKIPAGAAVTVTEDAGDYTQTITGQPEGAEDVTGGISFTMPSADTTVIFDNEKDIVPDTGVVLDTLPYVMILALVAVGAVIFVRKRGRRVDD